MNLHEHKEDFESLISIVANIKHIPEAAVEKDYYIVMLLNKLSHSEYVEQCVFKGGTSLSKCYPGSIERFSEDIDLTFLGAISNDDMSNKQCEKHLKRIEKLMADGFQIEIIPNERNDRNKSSYIIFDTKPGNRIKLEIGSSIRPDPYSKKIVKSYIHEYLEQSNINDAINEFELEPAELNVLNIERTFLDKVMSVKRHAICHNLNNKVRHIYDVTRLYKMNEIQEFLNDKDELKRLLNETKSTDSFYLEKRNISEEYDPTGSYDFDSWKKYFDSDIKKIYQSLHEELLYTDEQQDFDEAIATFEKINNLFFEIGE